MVILPADISISTPGNTGFCAGDPPTTLYALNTDAGYDYQWYQDGVAVGTNTPIYTTDQFGDYHVDIIDQFGCTFSSNVINLFDFCNFNGGVCTGGTCTLPTDCDPGTLVQFSMASTPECNTTNFTSQITDVIPGSIQWDFDDPGSALNNSSSLPNPSHTYSHAGFFVVLLTANVDDPDDPGSPLFCWNARVDTVELAANFDVENGCPGEVIEFSDLSTFLPITSIASWSWDFGDPGSGGDNTSTDINPTHIYASQGSYTVSLTVTSTSGCTATRTKILEVYPLPSVNFEEPTVNCEATALNFIADVPATVTFVEWDFGDPNSGDANVSELFDAYHAYDQPGNYTITLFAQSIYGCTNVFSRNLTIEPNGLSGDISLSIPSPICEGDSTELTAPAGGISWLWSTGATTNSIFVLEAGVYEVTLTDAEGCEYSPDAVVIDVIPAPESPVRAVEYNDFGLPLAYFYDGYESCFGEDIFLETTPIANYTYQWSNGDPGPDTEYTEERGNLLDPGTYDIFLDVTDNSTGCSNQIGPFVIDVHPLPQNVQIAVNPGGLLCEGSSATFSVQSPEAGLTYIWNTGQMGTSITTSLGGDYYVTAINEFGCQAESNHINILPGPDISKVPSGCHTRCRPDTICLPTIPGIVDYQWYFNGNPVAGPDGTMPELVALESGDYWLEMTDAFGCTLNSGALTLDLFDGFGTIDGSVYFDVNENGIIDAADTLLSGIDIKLLDGVTELDVTTSDVDGAYAFSNILSTLYNLELDTSSLPVNYSAYAFQSTTELIGCDAEETVDWLVFLDLPNL